MLKNFFRLTQPQKTSNSPPTPLAEPKAYGSPQAPVCDAYAPGPARPKQDLPAAAPGLLPETDTGIEHRVQATFDALEPGRFIMRSKHSFRLAFDLSAFPAAYCDALGVTGAEPLVVRIDADHTRPGAWVYAVTLGERPPLGDAAALRDPAARLLSVATRTLKACIATNAIGGVHADRRVWVNLYHAIADRLTHLGDQCVMCDKPHDVPGIKPLPCNDPMCVFQHDNLGIANAHLLQQHPALVDLLLSTAGAAAMNTLRRDNIFDDIPADFRIVNGSGKTTTEVDWRRLADTFAVLPSVQTMREAPDLAACLRARSPDAFALLRWVLNSTRAHVMSLSPSDRIASLGTEHQFLVCATTPQREAEFARARERSGGSFFAFHGSGLGNWHGILRQSLKNYSGKAMMSAGAAYGSGVYLGLTSSISVGYCGAEGARQECSLGSQPKCLAICEVIKGSARVHGNIAVVEREEHVILRALLVYSSAAEIPAVPANRIEDLCRTLFAAQASAFEAFENVRQATTAARLAAETQGRRAQAATLPPPLPADEGIAYDSESDDGSDFAGSSAFDDSSDIDVSPVSSPRASGAYASTSAGAWRTAPSAQNVAAPSAPSVQAAPPSLKQRGGSAEMLLARELRAVMKSPPTDGFALSLAGDSLLEWQAHLDIDPETSLGRDLSKLAVETGDGRVTLRLDFSPNYPHEPPFVWVESPRFARQCGFISGGAVCSTLLLNGGTTSSWSSVYTAEQVVRQIRALLMDPDAKGRLEDTTRPTHYTRSEASGGWTRAKKLHGWSEGKSRF